jgi:hypothetical protein
MQEITFFPICYGKVRYVTYFFKDTLLFGLLNIAKNSAVTEFLQSFEDYVCTAWHNLG